MYTENTRKHTLILLDTSLETVPHSISTHNAIIRDAKKRGKSFNKIILDDSIHHPAIRTLKDNKKRGRPDIAHFCLISALDFPLSSHMDIYVHTLRGDIIWVNNKTRLPRNFNRFKGLMESLWEKKAIKSGEETLMEVLDTDLDALLSSLEGKAVIMTEKGDNSPDYLKELAQKGDSIIICIGGFPHGELEEETLDALKRHGAVEVGLQGKDLTSNYVLNRVMCILEESWRS